MFFQFNTLSLGYKWPDAKKPETKIKANSIKKNSLICMITELTDQEEILV